MASAISTATSRQLTPSGSGAQGIHVDGATKTYHISGAEPVEALRSTDLIVSPGEFVSLVGPSGCGKTTLLKLVSGLDELSGGDIRVGDRRVTKPDPSVSVVFQRPALLKWYTVLQNILLPAKIAGTLTKDTEHRALDLLDFIGLADFRHRFPSELSGGMQQRTSIVRALVGDPQVLLMDEPFSALDEFTREVLHDELLRLWTESAKTVIFVTHNIGEAAYLSDRVAVMAPRPGRIEDIIDVTLDRPRTKELRSDPQFFELISDIRARFDQAGALGGKS